MHVLKLLGAALSGMVLCGGVAHGAFIVEAHVSGKANANFAVIPGAGNATGASASTASTAVGLSATNSVFGSNNTIAGVVDTYRFSYIPGTDADNTVLAAGTSLGNSSATDADGSGPILPNYVTGPLEASGATGGGSGLYNVYFTTPTSTNVNAAGSTFEITNDLASVVLNPVILNDTGTGPDEVAGAPFTGGANNRWLHLGSVMLTAGTTYTVTVTSNVDSFVSQRAHGVMWEPVPEPSTMLLGLGAIAGLRARRRV